MPKKTYVVRHGHNDQDNLSEMGRDQIGILGQLIKKEVGAGSVQLVTSTSPRAVQSAEILSSILEVSPEECTLLWSGPKSPKGTPFDLEAVLGLIQISPADAVVLVTHLEYSEQLPQFMGLKLFRTVEGFPFKYTEKGEAWLINHETGCCTRVRPDQAN